MGIEGPKMVDKRRQLVREKDPITVLLQKQAHWLAGQKEWSQIQELPRSVRRQVERRLLRNIFSDQRGRD